MTSPVVPLRSVIRLLVVDHAPTRDGMRMALGRDVEICAEAGDTEQGIRAAKLQQPDVCLVGREIPGDARRAVRGICRAAPDTAVVVLSAERDVDDLLEMVRAGATGYYPGPVEAERLSTIIRAVAANEAVVPRSLVLELMLELRDRDGLTGRESQVLGLLRRGNTTADISRRLEIAPVTVRRHISELVHKLGVQDRRSLIGPAAGPAPGPARADGGFGVRGGDLTPVAPRRAPQLRAQVIP